MAVSERYTIETTVDCSFDEAIDRVTEQLKTEGFGVLTRIDVDKTLQEKIGAEFDEYVILGACNPHLAYKGLSSEKNLGALLPCNVVVHNDSGTVRVFAMDPGVMDQVIDNPVVDEIAVEAQDRLNRVIAAL